MYTFSLFSTFLLSLSLANASASVSKRTDYPGLSVQLTFFGYPDNCDTTSSCSGGPPCCYKDATAYDCLGRNFKAGGDGSWENPLTVAFKEGGNTGLQQCDMIYIPYLQKYGVLDGLCASCEPNHLDIWVQSGCHDDADNVCTCEDSLTSSDMQYVFILRSLVSSLSRPTAFSFLHCPSIRIVSCFLSYCIFGLHLPYSHRYIWYDVDDNTSVFNVVEGTLYDQGSQTCTTKFGTHAKRDGLPQPDSMQSSANQLLPRELLGYKKRGACSENTCTCTGC